MITMESVVTVNGQNGQDPAMIETVLDQPRKLGGDAFVGCFFHEAMQDAGLRKRLFSAQPPLPTSLPPALPVARRKPLRFTVLNTRPICKPAHDLRPSCATGPYDLAA